MKIFVHINKFLGMFTAPLAFGAGGGFSRLIRRVSPIIDESLGLVDDINVGNNYAKVKQRLTQLEKERQDIGRYQQLASNYSNGINSLTPEDITKTTPVLDKYNPKLTESDAFQRYNFYKSQAGNEAPKSFEDFVNSDLPPESRQALIEQGLLREDVKNLDPDEIRQLVYERQGFKPEDIEFYNSKVGEKRSIQDFNRELGKYVADNEIPLTSMGKLGNKYHKQLLQNAALLEVTPKKGDYTYKDFGDKMYRIDNITGEMSVVAEKEGDVTPFSKEPRIIDNGDGTFTKEVDVIDKKGNLTTKKSKATDKEYEVYLTQIENKTFSNQEKMQQALDNKKDFYGYRISTGGSSSSSKKGKFSINDVNKDQVAEIMKYGSSGADWDKMKRKDKNNYIAEEKRLADKYFGGDIKKLQDTKEKMRTAKGDNAAAKEYLNYLNSKEEGDTNEETGKTDSFPKTPNTGKIIDKVKAKAFVTAVENFQNFIESDKYGFEQDGKKVPNYKISAADWARELSYQPFIKELDEMQMNALSDWFLRKTGQSLDKYLKFQ